MRRGWIELNITTHGCYWRSLCCCDNSGESIKFVKSRRIHSLNLQEDYFKCSKCGAEFMEQHQEFFCSHTTRKLSKDLSYTLYIKKVKL